jgi:hypothetical protein
VCSGCWASQSKACLARRLAGSGGGRCMIRG